MRQRGIFSTWPHLNSRTAFTPFSSATKTCSVVSWCRQCLVDSRILGVNLLLLRCELDISHMNKYAYCMPAGVSDYEIGARKIESNILHPREGLFYRSRVPMVQGESCARSPSQGQSVLHLALCQSITYTAQGVLYNRTTTAVPRSSQH